MVAHKMVHHKVRLKEYMILQLDVFETIGVEAEGEVSHFGKNTF